MLPGQHQHLHPYIPPALCLANILTVVLPSMQAQIYTLLPLTHVCICFSEMNAQGLAHKVYICCWQGMNLPSVFRLVPPAVLCRVPVLLAHSAGFTPLPCLQTELGALVPSSHVSGCVSSQSYICVVVRLENSCFSSFPAFFPNTVKEKHTHLPELGVLLTAEQSDGCARTSFHQNLKPRGCLLPLFLSFESS